MAIKVGGTEVVDNNRQLKNIASVDATTVAALGTAGVGGGGGKFSATADGAIAIGKPVELQSNGTVKQVVETINDIGIQGFGNSSNTGGGPGYGYQPVMAFFPDYNSVFHLYMYNNGAYLRRSLYDSTNGTLTNTDTPSSQQANQWDACMTVAHDPVRNTLGLLVQQNDNLKLYIYYIMESSVASNVVSVTTAASTSDTSSCLVCDRATGNYHVFYNENQFYSIRASLYTPVISSSNSVSITTVRSNDQIINLTGTHINRHLSAAKDESSTSDFMLVHKRSVDNAMQADYFTHNSSGVSNVGSALYATGSTTGNQSTQIAYNTEDAKFVVSTNYGNPSTGRIYTLLKPSSTGGNPTVSGSPVNYTTSNAPTSESTRLVYDPKTKDVVVCYWDTTHIRARRVDSSGTSPTVGTVQNVSTSDGSGYLLNDFIYLSSHNTFIRWGRSTGSNGHSGKSFRTSTATTNNATWIGFAEGAISDTASGDILVLGSTAENQSGLTIGSTYYVQPDGTLGTATANAIKAGRAIAANKLLITEGNAS